MSFFKWFKRRDKNGTENPMSDDTPGDPDDRGDDIVDSARDGEKAGNQDEAEYVYFTMESPNSAVLEVLNTAKKQVETIHNVNQCIEYIKLITRKVFLIIEGIPPQTLIDGIQSLKQIDSVFVYCTISDAIPTILEKPHTYMLNWCRDTNTLKDIINKSRDELDKHAAAFSMFNKKEKATRDLSKEAGSFLFFQLFKIVIKSLPKTADAKRMMITTCQNYYRGNITELANIDDFDKNYKPEDAIPWYTKETFVYKFINKALRTEDVDVLYRFRFYILDLSEQLEKKFNELKEKQTEPLKLYRGLKLSHDEVQNFQNSIGNLISTNGYLSTSSERSVAYGFATKSAKREGVVRALFEYLVDLTVVTKIVIADIRQYSAFPEEAEVLVDIGASFQIDSCEFSEPEDLWYVKVHATDQGADLAAEYMEYQKKKMTESNVILMLGNLLLEMGEYTKAEQYFDTILNSANPNDEEIACIYFNFGRTHRLKGDFARALRCYDRAFNLHMNARPKRSESAAKTLNGLGVVYCEMGRQMKGEECFQHAMQLYKKNVPKNHVDVAGTLINLGTIDCNRQDYDHALIKYRKAKKMYDMLLPPGHPNQALPRVNLGNVYLSSENYEMALVEYQEALKLQETSLPSDHPDIARTLHNLAIVHTYRGNTKEAKEFLERAQETANKTLSAKHPIMTLLDKTKNFFVEETKDYVYSRH